MSREDDVESSTRKLVNQVAKINDERFHAMIKLKVTWPLS
jgi:structural maintenance of chromosomes protein 5